MSSEIKTRPARRPPPPIGRAGSKVFGSLALSTKFADPTLCAKWPRIVGDKTARLCRPGRMVGDHHHRTLEIIAPTGAAAAQLSLQLDQIRREVNMFLGANIVRNIRVRQRAPNPAPQPAPQVKPAPDQPGAPDGGPLLGRFLRKSASQPSDD